MHSHTKLRTRQFLARGLVAGLLFSQTALSALAQTAPAANTNNTDKPVVLETFTVTAGFAGSLAAAAEMKQNQKVITEVISAEDIGKLPDISIADALTRLTGLTTQRTNGRSQQISIRGLNGDFSTGLLNGREQVSTGLNRAVEFDQYPADLLSSVVVYKTAAPNLTGQGLAGTIDLRTVRPLEKSGRVVAASGYYEWNERGQLTPGAESTGNRFTLSYIDQLQDGKLGIALGYSHTTKPFTGEQFQAWGYPTDPATDAFALGGTKSYVRNSVIERDGWMGVIEYKPNANIHSTIDIFYSDFEEKQVLRGMEVPLAFWSGAELQPGYTTSGGLITNATLTNVQPIVRNDSFVRTDKPVAVGWNLVLGKESAWPVTFDASFSKVTRDDFNVEIWSGLSHLGTPFTTADTMTVQLTPGGLPKFTTQKNYADGSILRVADPQGWQSWKFPNGSPGYYKGFSSKDELTQLKLSTRHELSRFFEAVEVGVSYIDRYKRDGENPSGFPILANGAGTAAMPASIGTTDFSYLGFGQTYAFDALAYFNSGAFALIGNDGTDFVARRFTVREEVTQFYTQFDINTKAGNVPVTGNVGFRVLQTDQSSNGLSANGSTVTVVSDGDTYAQFAPSLNLNFEFTERSVLRFSLARQIARPRMYDMRASRTFGYDTTKATSTDVSQSPWSGGGGNSALRPWVADSADLSYEHYFNQSKGYFAVAGFAKKLRNFVYEQSSIADFSGYPISGASPALFQGAVSQPMNGDGGNIRGLELSLTLTSELLSDSIKGFGLQLGGAFTKSSIKPWGPTGGDAPIAGLSEKVAQVTAYYERHGFSARVSNRYRSENRQYITTFGPPSQGGDVNPNGGFSMAQPESVVDGQISYTFAKDSALKNLSIFLQGYNLTDEPLITYNNDDPRQVINFQKYGASYSVGAAYKF